jgi:hypothetical protein
MRACYQLLARMSLAADLESEFWGQRTDFGLQWRPTKMSHLGKLLLVPEQIEWSCAA